MKLHRLHPPVSRAAHWFICGILAASAPIWSLPEKAHAAAYTFTNIADSDGIFARSENNITEIRSAALSHNNFDTVAFTTRVYNGEWGVFSSDGGPIQTMAATAAQEMTVL